MSPANMQAVGPFAPSVLKPRNKIIDKGELANRAIYRLVEEDEQLRETMERIRFQVENKHRWLKLRSRLKEVEKELEELRDMAATEKKKHETEKVASEKKSAAEAEKKRQAEKAASERKRAAEAEKKRQEEKAAAERKRAAEKAAAEQKRKEELLKQKEEEKKALQAQLAAEQKRRAEADAAIKKFKEEWAVSEEKKRQQLVKKADEEIQLLNAELAETKKRADLFASYERERAVVEARKKLEAAKRRLKLEYDEWRKKSYEAWKVQDRERQRVEEENLRRDARKKKEASDARKQAEEQTSSVQRPKEVSFDDSRNQTYDNRSAPQTYQRPAQHDVRHTDKETQQKDHYASHSHSHPQNGQPKFLPRDASRPKESVPEQHLSSPHYSKYHHEGVHPPTFGVSPHNQKAPLGLSGMPAGSSIASQFPAAAPWEEKHWSSNNYPAAYGAWEHSHRDVPSQNPSATERKWPTSEVSTWNGPVHESKAMNENHFTSPAHVARLESPKEKWPLPPSSPRISNESKGWDVPSHQLQETEESKLRREVEEYKKKCAKLAADLERKRRVTGTDSVATWQTGTKSIWEDPTKHTSLTSPKDAPKDTNYDPQGHQSDAPRAQTARSSSSRHNERDSQKDNKGTGSFKEHSKPTVHVSNFHRQQPSASNHYSSKSRPEPVNRKTERPESRASIETRYFEAEEYRNSDNDTPQPKSSNRDTQFKWRKASLDSALSYVPPTPHRRPSPPPVLPPTPPRGSRVSTPATLRPAPQSKSDSRQEIQTPKLTGIPGSWRDDPPNKDSSKNLWPANVSTPSVKSPPIAVKAKEKFKPERYVPSYYAPKDVPPPGSYLSTDTRHQQPGYGHSVPPYYGDQAAIPQPGPAYPIHHPLYAPHVQALTHSMDVEAGPSRLGGQFSSWADPTAAQSLRGTQAPSRIDKGKGKAW